MIGRVQKNGHVVQPQINAELEKVIVMRMKIAPGRLNVEVTIALLMTVLAPFFHQQLIVAMILIQKHVSKRSLALGFFMKYNLGFGMLLAGNAFWNYKEDTCFTSILGDLLNLA